MEVRRCSASELEQSGKTAASAKAANGLEQPAPADGQAFLSWASEHSKRRQQTLAQLLQSSTGDACPATVVSSETSSAAGLDLIKAFQSSSGSASIPAYHPHNFFKDGPAKPACHEVRIQAANAIHKMRATRNGEIGGFPLAFKQRSCCQMVTAWYTEGLQNGLGRDWLWLS